MTRRTVKHDVINMIRLLTNLTEQDKINFNMHVYETI